MYQVSISDEITALSFSEKVDRYYPSEHEAILTHLILGMYYLKSPEPDKVKVELRRAARYLEANYDTDRKHFDSSSLRIWLASMWSAVGEWKTAQVDLKVALKLDPTLT